MTFDEYDREAEKTANYPRENNIGLCYVFLGLVEEAGECSGKIKKIIRDEESIEKGIQKRKQDIIKELGDVLWYVSACAREIGTDLETIAKENNKKLQSRYERGTIKGSGDNR